MPREDIKVRVSVENGRSYSNSDCSDQAVIHFADGLPTAATLPIQGCRVFIVRGKDRNILCAGKETSQASQVCFITCAGQDFHSYYITESQFFAHQSLTHCRVDE